MSPLRTWSEVIALALVNLALLSFNLRPRDNSSPDSGSSGVSGPTRTQMVALDRTTVEDLERARREVLKKIHVFMDREALARWKATMASQKYIVDLLEREVSKRYGNFIRTANISPETAAELHRLLALRQINTQIGVKLTPELQAAGVPEWYEFGTEFIDAQIETLIGASRFAPLETYRKEIPSRTAVDKVGQRLGAYSLPMRPEQQSELVQIFSRFPDTVAPKSNGPESENWSYFEANVERYKKISEAAGTVLSAEQLKILEAHFADEVELIESRHILADKNDEIKKQQIEDAKKVIGKVSGK